MKTIFSILAATMLLTPSKAHALFSHVAQEKERRLQVEQQLAQEQQRNGSLIYTNEGLHGTISLLSAGAVGALLIGAAIGSKTRRDHETNG